MAVPLKRALLRLQCLVLVQSCQQAAAGDTYTYGCHSTCHCSIGHTLLSCKPGKSFQDFCRLCTVTAYRTRCILGDQGLNVPLHESCQEVSLVMNVLEEFLEIFSFLT